MTLHISEPVNLLEEIIDRCSKEIKEEQDNIKQILLTILSSCTNNPQNTRILAPSGEGKTYLVTKLAALFPQENIITLAKATPQSFKYALSAKVIENGIDVYQDYAEALKPLEEEYKKAKTKEEKEEIKQQIRDLRDSQCDLVDFTNKVIILVDSQSFELFESLKSTLSHDQQEIKSFSVNKSRSGMIQGQKFIIRGFPAVIYCSAKDEQKKDTTDEINTRFNTISLNASPKKYRKMLELEAIRSSLPHSMRQEEIISEEQIEELKENITDVIQSVEEYGECWNPFGMGLQKLFSDDGGFRTRQLKILNNNITIHTLANSKQRPKIIHDGIATPVATRADIDAACKLTKEAKEIQPYKIKFFNDYIRPAILEYGNTKSVIEGEAKCLTAREIAEYITNKGRTTDRQRLQETILRPLIDHGFLEEFEDPDNKRRYVYSITQNYLDKEAELESTLIDTSTLDDSCLRVFIENYIEYRFESGNLRILDKNDNEITPNNLLEILNQIDIHTTQNRHENGSVDSSIDVENKG